MFQLNKVINIGKFLDMQQSNFHRQMHLNPPQKIVQSR